jgi:hypothetical protein
VIYNAESNDEFVRLIDKAIDENVRIKLLPGLKLPIKIHGQPVLKPSGKFSSVTLWLLQHHSRGSVAFMYLIQAVITSSSEVEWVDFFYCVLMDLANVKPLKQKSLQVQAFTSKQNRFEFIFPFALK